MAAINGHHFGNFFLTVHSFSGKGDEVFLIKAIFHVQIDQFFEQGPALVFFIRGHFAKQCDGADGVLIADLAADHKAIAFFTADDVVLAPLFFLDQLGNIFEPGERVVAFNVAAARDLVDEFGGDDGFDDHVVRFGDPFFLAGLYHIIEGEDGGLIAVQQGPLSLAVFHADAYPISVRVGAEEDIGIDLLGFAEADAHGFAFFGVGEDYGREISIRSGLFVDDVDICKPEALEHLRNQLDAAAVDGSINDPQIMLTFNSFRVNGQVAHHGDIGFVDILADHGDVGLATAPFDFIDTGDLFDFGDDILIVRRDELTAVVPIRFVAIVFLWVVRGGANDAPLAAEVA